LAQLDNLGLELRGERPPRARLLAFHGVHDGHPPRAVPLMVDVRKNGSGPPWGSARARSPRSARACAPAAGPGRSRSGRPRSRLAANGDHQDGQRACAPTPRHEGSPLDVRAVTIWGQDRHRDGVLVDVQAKVDGANMRDTGHGRLLPYVAPSAPSWMTHALVTAERSRPLHAD
jgi:hypothetical protein